MITAIVLAAGSSRRMGKDNKLLLPMQNQTVIETVVDHLLELSDIEIIVVLGHEADRVQSVLGSRKVKMVINQDHLKGMTTSIQCGIRAAAPDSLGYLICLADLPLISSTTYQSIVQAFLKRLAKQTSCILIPTYQSKKGHPIVFARHFKEAILNNTFMEGCKNIIQANPQDLYFLQSNDPSIILDMDTPSDYQKIRRS